MNEYFNNKFNNQSFPRISSLSPSLNKSLQGTSDNFFDNRLIKVRLTENKVIFRKGTNYFLRLLI